MNLKVGLHCSSGRNIYTFHSKESLECCQTHFHSTIMNSCSFHILCNTLLLLINALHSVNEFLNRDLLLNVLGAKAPLEIASASK